MPRLASLQRAALVAGRRPSRRAKARGFALLGVSLLLAAALAGLGPHVGAFAGRPAGNTVVPPPLPTTGTSTPSAAAAAAGLAGGAAALASASLALASAAIITSRMLASRRFVVRRAEGEQSGEPIPLEDLKVGDKFDATVTRIAKIGIWVSIGAQKDALWPRAALPKGANYKVGDKITDVIITEVQAGDTPQTRKIRVGRDSVQEADVGKSFEATVTNVTPFGVFFDIGADKDALGQASGLTKALSEYKKGDKVTVKLVESGAQSRVTDDFTETLSYEDLEIGQEVSGVVNTVSEQFGLFVSVGLPKEALYRSNQLEKPLAEYKQGDKIAGLRIAKIDLAKQQVEVTTRGLAFEVKVQDTLEGTVTNIDEKFGVFFDAGLWSEVLAPTRMLSKKASEYLKGQVADLTVVSVDKALQRITVTDKPSDQLGTALGDLIRGSTVTGTVTGSTNSGILVEIGAMKEALLPSRSLDKPKSEYKEGDVIEGLIISKVDTETARLEVTLPMDPERETAGFEGFAVGDSVEGTVTRVMPFGTFVDIGGARDAMLQPVDAVYKRGDKLTNLRVTVSDPDGTKLGVTTRKLASDFSVGEKIPEATVTNIQQFGIFVDIKASMEALIPRSRLAKDPSEYAKGQKLTDLVVLRVDEQENKLSVGEVDGVDVDRGVTYESLKVGEKVTGTVRAEMDYGVFMDIGLRGRQDALLPKSFIPEGAPEMKPGMEIEVYILSVNAGQKKVSVSMTEPPKGGVAQISEDEIPQGDMLPDPKLWCKHYPHMFRMDWLATDPVPWEEWEEKYPGLIELAKKDKEVYFYGFAESFPGILYMNKAPLHYFPVPPQLRSEDAGPPEIPGREDAILDYDIGIKPEFYVKYRVPPFNDPNWTYRLPPAEAKKYVGLTPMETLAAREREEAILFEKLEKEQEEADKMNAKGAT